MSKRQAVKKRALTSLPWPLACLCASFLSIREHAWLQRTCHAMHKLATDITSYPPLLDVSGFLTSMYFREHEDHLPASLRRLADMCHKSKSGRGFAVDYLDLSIVPADWPVVRLDLQKTVLPRKMANKWPVRTLSGGGMTTLEVFLQTWKSTLTNLECESPYRLPVISDMPHLRSVKITTCQQFRWSELLKAPSLERVDLWLQRSRCITDELIGLPLGDLTIRLDRLVHPARLHEILKKLRPRDSFHLDVNEHKDADLVTLLSPASDLTCDDLLVSSVSADDLRTITQLPNLRGLSFKYQTEMSRDEFRVLQDTKLIGLEIRVSKLVLDDALLQCLPETVCFLKLENAMITSTSGFERLVHLEELTLDQSAVDCRGLEQTTSLLGLTCDESQLFFVDRLPKSIRSLDLQTPKMAGFSLPRLVHLTIRGTLQADGIETILDHDRLTSLTLSNSIGLALADRLVDNLPNLVFLKCQLNKPFKTEALLQSKCNARGIVLNCGL